MLNLKSELLKKQKEVSNLTSNKTSTIKGKQSINNYLSVGHCYLLSLYCIPVLRYNLT